ncbi:MAG TPA: folylpolyglutamate synthase/dihydrofolate synthase family protein [Pyrinomonadaceae bacterium]|nr:folylpolyglutamate synthase/dihydrofolate synthase family protein [Pyrinomonadaceae bacterium]
MNFQESVDYLYGLGNEVLAMKLGLENIRKLLSALGNPEKKYLKIQIAGTNGKGSTVAFLESICLQAGIKIGATTSPHLISVTERVRIKGVDISEKEFAKLATKVREISEQLVEKGELETVPTYFEQVTAIALLAFAENEVELAILETGLGGRFDATTAANAEIVAITPIDLDHQRILGDTIAQIAAEKAAIIREDTKVVVSEQKTGALKVILDKCREKNVVPIISSENEFNEKFPQIHLGLEGEHQKENALTAINLAEILVKDFKYNISQAAIEKGLETAKHKGRLEWTEFENVKFLFDGAHNVSGAQALRKYLETIGGNFTLVFGAMKDKDLTEIAEILFPQAEDIIFTKADNPRSMDIKGLAEYAEKIVDKSKIFTVENVADALDSAIQINSTYPATKLNFVCVTGSLYLVGEAQNVLENQIKKAKGF